MKDETGTRFYDWIGYLWLQPQDPRVAQLAEVGYIATTQGRLKVHDHPAGMFPTVVVRAGMRLLDGI